MSSSEIRTGKYGRCREVAVMGRFSKGVWVNEGPEIGAWPLQRGGIIGRL